MKDSSDLNCNHNKEYENKNMKQQKFLLISCAVLARECYSCASISRNIIDIKILEQGLHDVGEVKMAASLQNAINMVEADKYDAILLAYGLCNNGIRNLHAELPLVIPRAHDCITLLMGSKTAYKNYFNEYPGTFFQSIGWSERSKDNLSNPDSTTRQMGLATYEEYVQIYGEENAKYLMEELGDGLKNYTRLTFIDTGMKVPKQKKRELKEWARSENWEYDEYQGNTRLLLMLMNGDWDESEFLVVFPGNTISPTYDDGIIQSIDK
jgi:hypothetical protein